MRATGESYAIITAVFDSDRLRAFIYVRQLRAAALAAQSVIKHNKNCVVVMRHYVVMVNRWTIKSGDSFMF